MDTRRKRLKYRSWHRGIREMDLLLGRFADRYVAEWNDADLDCFEALLEVGDPELLAWISGRQAVPATYDNDVTRLLLNFKIGKLDI